MTEVNSSVSDAIPYGYCHCGCGEKTSLAKYSRKSRGWVKGEPVRFIRAHTFRVLGRRGCEKTLRERYTVEDRGFATPCWVWQGSTTDKGYAKAMLDGDRHRVHRVFYGDKYGPIPHGLQPDHLCRVRNCINPDHLELVTNAENTQRGLRAKLTPFRVAQMRRLRQAGHSISALAKAYNISQGNTRKIIRRLTWKEVA